METMAEYAYLWYSLINYIALYVRVCSNTLSYIYWIRSQRPPVKRNNVTSSNFTCCWCLFLGSTFVGSAWSFGFFIPATTVNDLRLRRIFYPRFYPLHFFSYLNSWERASIFHFECSVLNNGTTGTNFITSLVWRGPWLGIEVGTSRTRTQHYTTRLSRRRFTCSIYKPIPRTFI